MYVLISIFVSYMYLLLFYFTLLFKIVDSLVPNFNPMMLLHGEQYTEFKKPFPTSGQVISQGHVIDVLDKGKAASVIFGVTTKDAVTGEVLCENQFTNFIRGSGGFGGKKDSERGAATAANTPPSRAPDAVVREATTDDQAALYRLSGDYNPLHLDPSFAAVGGFDRPILHGLCTFGIAGKHILKTYGDMNPASFKSIKVRFAKHVVRFFNCK
jgi:multifunctional beta-oxidation protein